VKVKRQVFVRQEAFGICAGRPVDIEDGLGGLSCRDGPEPKVRAPAPRSTGQKATTCCGVILPVPTALTFTPT
jgi:hypothetical protein